MFVRFDCDCEECRAAKANIKDALLWLGIIFIFGLIVASVFR